MMYATQDTVYREIRRRLVDSLNLPYSRVYLTSEPQFTEAMDFALQITPIAGGSTNEFNKSGLGFITEKFAVTTFVRTASDNDIKQSRQLAGLDHGVLNRQADVRSALIQQTLDGLLTVAIRFVSSGPVRQEPRASVYLSSTDVYVCSYALPWPVAGKFRYGFSATKPTWATLTNEFDFANSIRYDATATRLVTTSQYLWFAFPQSIHDLGVTLSTPAGVEPFYRTGFLPPSGPGVGPLVESGVTYQLYRRAYPTTALSLAYSIEVD